MDGELKALVEGCKESGFYAPLADCLLERGMDTLEDRESFRLAPLHPMEKSWAYSLNLITARGGGRVVCGSGAGGARARLWWDVYTAVGAAPSYPSDERIELIMPVSFYFGPKNALNFSGDVGGRFYFHQVRPYHYEASANILRGVVINESDEPHTVTLYSGQ